MPTSEAQKRANQKWREANKERYNSICKEAAKKQYNENREVISAYKKEWYKQKKLKLQELKKESETL